MINTISRKPRQPRLPFSFPSIVQLAAPTTVSHETALASALTTDQITSENADATGPRVDGSDDDVLAAAAPKEAKTRRRMGTTAVPLDMGTWGVDQIQLCEMGSHAPDGAYVSASPRCLPILR